MIPGRRIGRVISARDDSVTATLPLATVGEGVRILTRGARSIPAVVARIEHARVVLTAFAPIDGVTVGDAVETCRDANVLGLGVSLLGRAIDSAGVPLDRFGPVRGRRAPVLEPPIDAGARTPIREPLWTGIRAIDGFLTIGRGARVGAFGPPAAGKSTLIEMLVQSARADAIVVGLVGERGREAAAWMEKIAPHVSIVCAPLDRSPAERVRAGHVAMAQGSQLRRRGLSVLVILDSLARFAAAARELGVQNGETVGRGGYPPSAFAEMAKLLERGGNAYGGSLTMIATVLSDGPEENDPLSEAARASLDGHIVLSRSLAQVGHFPAIDILKSASRTMGQVVDDEHRNAAQALRGAMAVLEETKEARRLGLTTKDPKLDRALRIEDRLLQFLRQSDVNATAASTRADLLSLASVVVGEKAAA